MFHIYRSVLSMKVSKRCQVQNNWPQDGKSTQIDATAMQDKRSVAYRCVLQSSDMWTVQKPYADSLKFTASSERVASSKCNLNM